MLPNNTTFGGHWVIREGYSAKEWRNIVLEQTGEEIKSHNAHYLCTNSLCGVATYMENTTIARAINDGRPVMSYCKGCNGEKKDNGKCRYSTQVRIKPLYKVPERNKEITVGENFELVDILPSGNFSDHQKRVVVRCVHCGKEQTFRADHLTDGQVACECFRNHSSGEMAIKAWLNSHGFTYETEVSYPDLVGTGGNLLRFDFRVNGKLIEFDGEQHFKPNAHFGEEAFEILQIHDSMKDSYVKEHSIPLLRIRYDEFNSIADKLTNYLKGAQAE